MKKIIAPFLLLLLFLAACGSTADENSNQQGTTDDTETLQEEEMQEGSIEDGNGESSVTSNPAKDAKSFSYNAENVSDFELHIEMKNGDEQDYDFNRPENEGEIEIESNQEEEAEGQEAFDRISDLLNNIEIAPDRPLEEMMNETASHLNLAPEDIKDFELEAEFEDGQVLAFNSHIPTDEVATNTIDEFDLDMEFTGNVEWQYDYEKDGEYEIERSNEENYSGDEAKELMEDLFSNMEIVTSHTIHELKTDVVNGLSISSEHLQEFEYDAEFDNGKQLSIKHELGSEQ